MESEIVLPFICACLVISRKFVFCPKGYFYDGLMLYAVAQRLPSIRVASQTDMFSVSLIICSIHHKNSELIDHAMANHDELAK